MAASRSWCSQPAGPVEPVQHPPGQAADDLEALGVDVEQDQLVDRQAVAAPGEALDELRRVGAAAADDRDLDAHGVPPRTAGTRLNCL